MLARQFDDKVWSQQTSQSYKEIKAWTCDQVVEWAKSHEDIPDEAVGMFEVNKVNGMELLACGREDLKELGINRAGTLALVSQATTDLQIMSHANATTINQSPYCFGKIVDFLRLKSTLLVLLINDE
mmetsp:Transcript_13098/g.18046  ORF Transcript_13098/g.18046 Transcript_13098/m.18046 type:complete len:127 (-) Transcript_13098:515-895(-)